MSDKNPKIPERLYLLLANGNKYEISPKEGPAMLELLRDPVAVLAAVVNGN